MKHSIDAWLPYKEMMQRIAAEYFKKYPYVTQDDLQQEMYLWFVSHPRKFKEWSAMEQKDADKLIAKSLRNQCLKYCEKEKARVQGYELSDVYYYDVAVIEAFLPSIIAESYEMPAKIKDLGSQGKTKSTEISDGMNWLALRSDIAKGYYKLPEFKQNILRLRYSRENADWNELSSELKTTPDGARMKVQRILVNLIHNLGGYRPYYDSDQIKTEEAESTDEQEG